MTRKKEIEKILNQARFSISSFCINECKAKCCRKGKLLLLNEKELNFICQNKTQNCFDKKLIEKTKQNHYTYNLEQNSCPFLDKEFKCKAWKDKQRPKICKDFPLILYEDKYIITSNFCPAVEKKLFEKYFKELKKLGLKII